MTDEQSAYCEGCGHLSKIGSEHVCEYAADTNRLRGCDVGPGCQHHTEVLFNGFRGVTPRRGGRKPLIDDETARAMYDAGAKDTEIAEKFGVDHVSVANWRKKQGLPSWQSRIRKENSMKRSMEEKEAVVLETEALENPAAGMTAEALADAFDRLGNAWPDCVVLVGDRPVRRVKVSLCFDGEPEPSAKMTLEI